MPTPAQLAANRQNALKSTGPRTQAGKDTSRYNALRHGILSQSLIPACLEPYESRAEFDALHQDLRADLDPRSTLEDLLVERIAVTHWRLARLLRAESGAIARRQTHPDEQSIPYHSLDRHLGLPHRDDLTALLYAKPSGLAFPDAAEPSDDAVLPNEPNPPDRGTPDPLSASPTPAAADTDADRRDAILRAQYSIPALEPCLAFARYEAALDRQLYRALTTLHQLQQARPAAPAEPSLKCTPKAGHFLGLLGRVS